MFACINGVHSKTSFSSRSLGLSTGPKFTMAAILISELLHESWQRISQTLQNELSIRLSKIECKKLNSFRQFNNHVAHTDQIFVHDFLPIVFSCINLRKSAICGVTGSIAYSGRKIMIVTVSHFVKLVCKAEKNYTQGLIVSDNSRKKTLFFFSKAPLILLSMHSC